MFPDDIDSRSDEVFQIRFREESSDNANDIQRMKFVGRSTIIGFVTTFLGTFGGVKFYTDGLGFDQD